VVNSLFYLGAGESIVVQKLRTSERIK